MPPNLSSRIQCFAVISTILMLFAVPSGADISCYQCHGSDNPPDYRPIDAPYRNIYTGGFVGNHRTHMKTGALPVSCTTCHPGSADYTSYHRDAKIKLSANINNSPRTALYKNSSTAFPQTSSPNPGTCSNINCHLESTTPTWGIDPATTGCTTCHGAPPDGYAPDYSGGASGSHGRHNSYYKGINNCVKCHSDHASESIPFAHATSIGTRRLVIKPRTPQNVPFGSYSAALTTGYLPSQAGTHSFGICSATYCHSDGTSSATGVVPVNTTPKWGSGILTCKGCHASPPDYSNGSPKANSHGSHNYGCNTCHYTTTSNGFTIITTSRWRITDHVDKVYTVNPGAGTSFNYSFSTSGGTCNSISCHSNGSASWGGSVACGNCHAIPPATGAHLIHSDGSSGYGSDSNSSVVNAYRFNCGNCHPLDTAKHGNGVVDLELYNPAASGLKNNNPANAARTGSGNATVCLNIYCHSSGQDADRRSYAATPQWGGTFSGNRCAGCHGDPPAYANGGVGSADANSHYASSMSYDNPVEGGHLVGLHFDNIRKDPPDEDAPLFPRGGSAGSGSGHGDPETSTTISCPTCHAATVAVAGQFSAQGTAFDCTSCHTAPLAGSIADKSRHVNGVRDVEFMTGNFRTRAQLRLTSFTSTVKPLGWTRNNDFKTANNSYDSVPFSGSYNAADKSCTTVCHLNQPIVWGDTSKGCFACHADL